MIFKKVMTWSPGERKARLFRIMWQHGKTGDGVGYSAKLAVSLVPMAFGWTRYLDGWRATFAGVSLHYRVSYSGRFV